MTEKIRIIYAGTPDFSVPALEALIHADKYEVVAVYTQPDRPAGRGREYKASPVKQVAQAAGIPVLQPVSLQHEETRQALMTFKPDVMVVAAYGLLLPEAVLQIPVFGCINIHASLLPRWRGAAPIQRAILANDKKTGISIMQMDKGLDTGNILAVAECPIHANDTASCLHDRLMYLGAETLLEVMPMIISQSVKPVVQDNTLASYASKLSKSEAEINWRLPALQIERAIRAYNAWPVAFSWWQKKNKSQTLRIWQAQSVTEQNSALPGTVIAENSRGIDVVTGNGILRIQSLQPQGKRAMPVADFLNASSLLHQVLGQRE